MYEFDYQRPASVKAAVKALGADEEARVVAGGMTLLPTMKLRLAMPSALWTWVVSAICLASARKATTL